MRSKKANLGQFLALLGAILFGHGQATAINYTYYPTYGIVTGTAQGILNITHRVAKIAPEEVGQKVVIGYVEDKGKTLALVLDGARSDSLNVEVENIARGFMRGEGLPVVPDFAG